MPLLRSYRRVALVLACLAASACNSEPTGVPAVIPLESETWASALGVTLSQFTKLTIGMYYRDTVEGTGTVLNGTPTVQVHYSGYLPIGTKFDEVATTAQPVCFPLNQLIDGWIVGLQGMKIGGTRRLLIPPGLGYGARANGQIPANSNLLFDVKLVGIGCTP